MKEQLPTESASWSSRVKDLYIERIAILVEGSREPTEQEKIIAKQQARAAHVEEVGYRTTQELLFGEINK